MDPKPSMHRTFKKKTSAADNRVLRAQLRSREQEDRRRDTVNRLRNLSPLADTPRNHSRVKSAAEKKRLALLKWKQERDLKKKLEREKKNQKPVFIVSASVDYSIRPLPKVPKPELKRCPSEVKTKNPKSQEAKEIKQIPTAQSSTGRRITRSQSSANAEVTSHHPNKENSTRKSTRRKLASNNDSIEIKSTRSLRSAKTLKLDTSTKPAATSVNSSKKQAAKVKNSKARASGVEGRKTCTAATDILECEAAEVDNLNQDSAAADISKGKADSTSSNDDEVSSDVFTNLCLNNVCSERANSFSFAPSNFCFSMPEGLPPFSYKPMSPASHADFLFPGTSVSDAVFKVPKFIPKRTPKQGNYTNSLILKTLSPEEKDEVISRSPMIETRRRTPKQSSGKKIPVDPLPTFDDFDIKSFPKIDKQAMDEAGHGIDASPEQSIPTSQGLLVIDTNSIEPSKQVDSNDVQCIDTSVATVHKEPVAAVITPTSNNDDQACQQQNYEKMDVETNINNSHSSSSSAGLDMNQKALLVANGKKEGNTENLEDVADVSKVADSERDVAYFRHTIQSEKDRLNALCEKWNLKLSGEEEIPEAAQGQIRSAVGQAQLLVNKRFKQFSGLVDDCEFGTGEKEILASDLQGFWDVIYFQVDDVHDKFEHLVKLEANNWELDKPKIQRKKVTKKKPVTNEPVKPSAKVKSKFADFRAKIKQQKTAVDGSITSEEVPLAQSDTGEMKTFEAGFFHVSSPVSSPKYHCEAGTPGKHAENTSSLQRSVVIKRHSISQSTSASPHLKQLSLKCENSKSEDPPNKPTANAQSVFSVDHRSGFTPENSSTPLKQPQKSLRRSLRLLSLSNSFALSKSPTTLRKRKKSSIGNQSLNAGGKENPDDSSARSFRPARRYSSAPAEKRPMLETFNISINKSALKSENESHHQNHMMATELTNNVNNSDQKMLQTYGSTAGGSPSHSPYMTRGSAMKTDIDQTVESPGPLLDMVYLIRTTQESPNSPRTGALDDSPRLSTTIDSPKSLKHQSMRKSLRLQSFSNSFSLSNTPKQLKKDMHLLLSNQSLGPESKENTNSLMVQESTTRRRSTSAPGGNTVYNNLLFTPMEKIRHRKAGQNDQSTPDGDLIAFSPL